MDSNEKRTCRDKLLTAVEGEADQVFLYFV